MSTEIWGLVIALIGVSGSLLGLAIQFKKDSNTIGKVLEKTEPIKNIDDNTKKVREELLENLSPVLKQNDGYLNNMNKDIKEILSDVEYRKRLEQSSSLIINEDVTSLIATINKMNATIVKQSNTIIEQEQKIKILTKDNMELKSRIKEIGIDDLYIDRFEKNL